MKVFKQFTLILCFSFIGEIISWIISKLIPGFFFPGSLIGMILLFILLYTKVIKISWVEDVGTFLVDNVGFFFIPAAVSVMGYFDIIVPNLMKMILLAISTFFITFLAIIASVELTLYIQRKCNKGEVKEND